MKHSVRKKLLAAAGVAAAVALFWYVSDYYRAEDVALEVMARGTGITVEGDFTILSPSVPSDTGIVFYPGAKVEAEAYLPLLDRIRQTGVTCVLVHMPFNMAIFDPGAAQDVFPLFPQIEHWYVAGHSMGGAMASDFASKHPDEVDGLILLGAYIYGDYPDEKTLTVYGSLNQSVEDHIDYTENIVEIEGGNHAKFGNYGPPERGPARRHLRGGTAGADRGGHRGVPGPGGLRGPVSRRRGPSKQTKKASRCLWASGRFFSSVWGKARDRKKRKPRILFFGEKRRQQAAVSPSNFSRRRRRAASSVPPSAV